MYVLGAKCVLNPELNLLFLVFFMYDWPQGGGADFKVKRTPGAWISGWAVRRGAEHRLGFCARLGRSVAGKQVRTSARQQVSRSAGQQVSLRTLCTCGRWDDGVHRVIPYMGGTVILWYGAKESYYTTPHGGKPHPHHAASCNYYTAKYK